MNQSTRAALHGLVDSLPDDATPEETERWLGALRAVVAYAVPERLAPECVTIGCTRPAEGVGAHPHLCSVHRADAEHGLVLLHKDNGPRWGAVGAEAAAWAAAQRAEACGVRMPAWPGVRCTLEAFHEGDHHSSAAHPARTWRRAPGEQLRPDERRDAGGAVYLTGSASDDLARLEAEPGLAGLVDGSRSAEVTNTSPDLSWIDEPDGAALERAAEAAMAPPPGFRCGFWPTAHSRCIFTRGHDGPHRADRPAAAPR